MDAGRPSQGTVCCICLKHLSSKQNLKQHLNIHSGEKPYVCNIAGCGHSYRHASQLSNHRLINHRSSIVVKREFDDFRAFIELVILALNKEEAKSFNIPEGPYKRKDAELPPITGLQYGVRLPFLGSLILK